jgi:SAM-dependent methyltransferase
MGVAMHNTFDTSAFPAEACRTRQVLDHVHDHLVRFPAAPGPALEALSAELRGARREQSADQWDQTIAACRAHPLRRLLEQDPLTARAAAMSRGYQGDAALLDIIYDRDYRAQWRIPVTPLGEAIFRHTIDCQAPSAVRERRVFLASQIDACCAANPQAHILAAACGHLRELELSHAVRSGTFGRFVGLDQDPETLTSVRRNWGPCGVEAMTASVTTFLLNPRRSHRYDFIYVAGLYDYLDDGAARLVTSTLMDLLRPGGRLLIGNFAPETRDAGYMEAFMGWRLIYRDVAALRRLAAGSEQTTAAIVPDTTGAVIYLDLTAAG